MSIAVYKTMSYGREELGVLQGAHEDGIARRTPLVRGVELLRAPCKPDVPRIESPGSGFSSPSG